MSEEPEKFLIEPAYDPNERICKDPVVLGESEGMIEMWKMFNMSILGMTFLIHPEHISSPAYHWILTGVRVFALGSIMVIPLGTFAFEAISMIIGWCCFSSWKTSIADDDVDKMPIITAAAPAYYRDTLSLDSIQLDPTKKPGIARLDLNLVHPDAQLANVRDETASQEKKKPKETYEKAKESVRKALESLKYFNRPNLQDKLQHLFQKGGSAHPHDDQFDGVCILGDVDD